VTDGSPLMFAKKRNLDAASHSVAFRLREWLTRISGFLVGDFLEQAFPLLDFLTDPGLNSSGV